MTSPTSSPVRREPPGRARAARVPLLVAAAAIVLALAYWVWPTPYRYVIPREPRIQVVRINRFTGDADYLLLNGWHRAKLPPGAKGTLKLDELLRDGQ